jgi:uncharacterized membrane-anchored protein
MALRRSRRATTPSEIVAAARVDRRTKDLIPRLQAGEIAVIKHRDLDRVAADGLIEAGVVAVVNCAPSISGRYPNGGPIRIVSAGITLLDEVGVDIMDRVHEGDTVRVAGGELWRNGELLGHGTELTGAAIEAAMEAARASIGTELERFAENTLEYIQKEARLTFEPLTLPPLHTDFAGRHALVVVRGHDYRSDLAALRSYIREYRPVLIGVDGGADALLEAGSKPDVIIGDFDSVSDTALRCGASLVVHAYADGNAPGAARLDALGLPYTRFLAAGTSEDIAMLLAFEKGAELIVAVGTHNSMVEFLDKGRPGMASTFLVRMKVGPILVDAKGVSRLYRSQVRKRDLLLMVVAALLVLVTITLISEPIRLFLRSSWLAWR